MYYSIDIYDKPGCRWYNWTETSDFAYAKETWHQLIEKGETARVRKVEDMTSGVRWID